MSVHHLLEHWFTVSGRAAQSVLKPKFPYPIVEVAASAIPEWKALWTERRLCYLSSRKLLRISLICQALD